MNKQRMIAMLTSAQGAIREAGFNPLRTELIGQLILASAIEESGSSISMSLDKLEKIALELGDIASEVRHSG